MYARREPTNDFEEQLNDRRELMKASKNNEMHWRGKISVLFYFTEHKYVLCEEWMNVSRKCQARDPHYVWSNSSQAFLQMRCHLAHITLRNYMSLNTWNDVPIKYIRDYL